MELVGPNHQRWYYYYYYYYWELLLMTSSNILVLNPLPPSVKGLNHKIKTPKANHIQFSITNPTFDYEYFQRLLMT